MPITNHFRPQGTVYVEVTQPCRVHGKHRKVGDTVEVSADDAGLITAAGRGKIVDAPREAKAPADAARK